MADKTRLENSLLTPKLQLQGQLHKTQVTKEGTGRYHISFVQVSVPVFLFYKK